MEKDRRKQRYTLGFVFDKDLKSVLLVHKKRPDWQKGKLNGIGGKYEDGERAEACIARETFEESTLEIPESVWIYVGTIYQQIGDVGILAAQYGGDPENAITNDGEKVEWFEVGKLSENSLSNVHWLVPLCIDKIQSRFVEFSIQY